MARHPKIRQLAPLILADVIDFTRVTRAVNPTSSYHDMLLSHCAGRMSMSLVLHVRALHEATDVVADLQLPNFSERTSVHVKFSSANHEDLGGVAELD